MGRERVSCGESIRSPLPGLEGLKPRQDRLDSWKEIAKHLGREVRTVQFWEKREGLPIHRHFHCNLSSVFAFRSELDAWRQRVSRPSVKPLIGAQEEAASILHSLRPKPEKVRIAVLPFEGLRRDPEQQRFDDGLASEINVALQHLCPEWLGVISRTAVMEYRTSAPRLEALGNELGARYALEGTSQVEDGRIRANISLVNVQDKTALWSQSYKGRLKDSLQLQSRVASQVAHCLCLTMLSAGESSRPLLPVTRPAASDAYTLGRFLWKQRTEESIRKAVRHFEHAIEEDPCFALAHAGLADCFTVLAFFGFVSSTEAKPAAQRAALRAVELDPTSAEAHASLALILFHFDHNWMQAEREFQEAIRCDPAYAFSYHGYAKLLGAKGQHDAAQIAITRAVSLDPTPITIVWAGAAAHTARRYDEALGHYRRALQFDPNMAWAHMYMAETLEQTGHIREALAEYDTAIHLCGGNSTATAMKAHAHAASGDRPAALKIVNDLSGMPNQRRIPSYDIAAVYAALGEHRQTFPWLHRACQEHNVKLFTLPQDPRFDPIRHRSEFRGLIDRAGLNIS
jgi:TolB-like protein